MINRKLVRRLGQSGPALPAPQHQPQPAPTLQHQSRPPPQSQPRSTHLQPHRTVPPSLCRPNTSNLSRHATPPPSSPRQDGCVDNEEPDDNLDEDDNLEVGRRRKRGPEQLRDALEDEVRRKKRKGGCKKTKIDSALKAFKKAGCWIVHVYGLSLTLCKAFHLGLAEDGLFVLEQTEDTDLDVSEQEKQLLIKLYRNVLSQVPNFKKTLEEFNDDIDSVMELIALMEKDSQSARQQDTNKMKEGLPTFFAHHEKHLPVMASSPLPRDKTGRGFNHIYSARALCPRARIYAFDNDEEFLEKITSGQVQITAWEYPNFLYDETQAEELYEDDPTQWDSELGLLRSPLCLWSYKCIFMGNGFWEPADKKKKTSVGKLNGLMQVTPATIAYAVAQARFALSSCEEWGAEDGNFILEAFYKVIMELFEDEEDQWVIDTLDWWNKQIFPNKPDMLKDDDNVEMDPNSAHSRVKQARMARARLRRDHAIVDEQAQ